MASYKVKAAAAFVIRKAANGQLFYRNSPVPDDAINIDSLLENGVIEEIADGDYAGGHPSDLPLDASGFVPGAGSVGVDYESLKVPELDAEVKRRNEGREEGDQIKPDSGKKADLIAALEVDDAASA